MMFSFMISPLAGQSYTLMRPDKMTPLSPLVAARMCNIVRCKNFGLSDAGKKFDLTAAEAGTGSLGVCAENE